MASIVKATRKKGIVYIARWYDANHAQQTKTFPTKEAALRHVRGEEARAANGDLFDHHAGKTIYETVSDEWINSKVFPKERTKQGYDSLRKTHVVPYFGDLAVGRIAKRDVQSWLKELSDSGVGAGTIRNAYRNVLKPSLDFAVDQGYLRANPAINLKLARSQRTEMAFLSAAQVRELADEISPHYRLLILFSSFTGLRAGEVAALRVGRLDLMRRTIKVAESASVVTGKGIVYGPTKTYTDRTVPVPSFLVDDLARYIADRASDPAAFVFHISDRPPAPSRQLLPSSLSAGGRAMRCQGDEARRDVPDRSPLPRSPPHVRGVDDRHECQPVRDLEASWSLVDLGYLRPIRSPLPAPRRSHHVGPRSGLGKLARERRDGDRLAPLSHHRGFCSIVSGKWLVSETNRQELGRRVKLLVWVDHREG